MLIVEELIVKVVIMTEKMVVIIVINFDQIKRAPFSVLKFF